jgi:hypothetical protein
VDTVGVIPPSSRNMSSDVDTGVPVNGWERPTWEVRIMRVAVVGSLATLVVAGCYRLPEPSKEFMGLRSALVSMPGFTSVMVTPTSTNEKFSEFTATLVHGGMSKAEVLESVRVHLVAKCPWFEFKEETVYGFSRGAYYYDILFLYDETAMEVRVLQSFSGF